MKSLESLPDCRRLPGCDDRRTHGRVNRSFPVRYRAQGLRFHQGRVLSVGVSGARMLAPGPLAEGSRVQVTLSLEPGWTLAAPARVVWSQPVGDSSVVGLEFTEIWRDDEDRLVRWVRKQAA